MPFKEEMSSFLDELSGIIDEQKKEKEEGMDLRTDSPFSSQLTQDEEPNTYNPGNLAEPIPPEMVVRGNG